MPANRGGVSERPLVDVISSVAVVSERVHAKNVLQDKRTGSIPGCGRTRGVRENGNAIDDVLCYRVLGATSRSSQRGAVARCANRVPLGILALFLKLSSLARDAEVVSLFLLLP
jgi:hypothetical protein